MRQAKRKAAARRKRGDPVESGADVTSIGPTAETRSKLRQDTLRAMLRAGAIRSEHLAAAGEIRDMWEALTTGITARSSWPSDPARAVIRLGRRVFQAPWEHLSERRLGRWRRIYKSWSVETGRVDVVPGHSRLELTIDVVVDGHSLAEVERRLRLRHGVASQHLRAALTLYAEMAGWLMAARRRSA